MGQHDRMPTRGTSSLPQPVTVIGPVTTINTLASNATVYIAPYSFYQNLSLVSGYNFYGTTLPGNAANTATFQVLRETILTGEVLYANGLATFISTWSSASLASVTYL